MVIMSHKTLPVQISLYYLFQYVYASFSVRVYLECAKVDSTARCARCSPL